MRRLRCRHDAFGPGERHGRGEGLALVDRLGLDVAVVFEQRHQGRHAVVAQAAGVDGLRNEVGPEREHLDQRRELAGVAEVVGVHTAGHRRRRLRLDRDHLASASAPEVEAQEWEGQPREVRAATGAGDDHVGILAGHTHLLDGLLADDRLVQQHVVEHRPEAVLGVVSAGRVLDRFADRNA